MVIKYAYSTELTEHMEKVSDYTVIHNTWTSEAYFKSYVFLTVFKSDPQIKTTAGKIQWVK